MNKKTARVISIISIISAIACLIIAFSFVTSDSPFPTLAFMVLTVIVALPAIYICGSTRNDCNWAIKNLKQEYVDTPNLIPIDLRHGEVGKYSDFNISKKIKINSVSAVKPHLLIDSNSKKFVYESSTNLSKVYSFSDLTNYEIYENGNNILNGSVAKPLIGGALFGVVGAIAAANTNKKITKQCTSLKLILHINDLNNPNITINYIDGISHSTDGAIYKSKMDNINEVCSILRYIINDSKVLKTSQMPPQNSTKQALQELKELFDDGLITEEDYEQKKKQILGL